MNKKGFGDDNGLHYFLLLLVIAVAIIVAIIIALQIVHDQDPANPYCTKTEVQFYRHQSIGVVVQTTAQNQDYNKTVCVEWRKK